MWSKEVFLRSCLVVMVFSECFPFAQAAGLRGGGHRRKTSAGVSVNPTSLTTSESGTSATFNVILKSQPTANVSMSLSSSDPTETAIDQNTLVFSSLNWNVAQVVRVSGVGDSEIDGDTTSKIVLQPAQSADTRYNGLDPIDVTVVNKDDDFILDTVPPLLSGIQVTDLSSSSAKVRWTTNEAADSLVEYGTTASYGSRSMIDLSLTLDHAIILGGLSPETTYHFRVFSKDAAGNSSSSQDFEFVTPVKQANSGLFVATEGINRYPSPEETAINSTGLRPVWNGSHWILFWEKLWITRTYDSTGKQISWAYTASKLMASVIHPNGSMETPREIRSLPLLDPTRFGDNALRSMDAIATNTGYLITWIEAVTYETSLINVLALDANLNSVGSSTISSVVTASTSNIVGRPVLGGKAGHYALVWSVSNPHQRVYIRTVGEDAKLGSVNALPVISHMDKYPIAWDGFHFGMAFESDREALKRCGCAASYGGAAGELMFLTFSASGSHLSTSVLSEGIEEKMFMYMHPSLVSKQGGGFAIVWSSTVNFGHDLVLAQVDTNGKKIGSNFKITSDGLSMREMTPKLGISPYGYYLSYSFNNPIDASMIYYYGVKTANLDHRGMVLNSLELVPPPYFSDRGDKTRNRMASSVGGTDVFTVWDSYLGGQAAITRW